jgi:hypothetical protein
VSIPQCPIHRADMRLSKDGVSYFCSKKKTDGTYCDQKWKPAAPPATPAGSAVFEPSIAVKVAAFDFASRLYHGQGADAEKFALDLVRFIIAEFS